MRIRLGDDDRQRYGGPEWLDFDPDVLLVGEALAVEEPPERGGLGLPAVDWWEQLHGRKRTRPDGTEAWWRPMGVWRLLVWMALRRAGVRVALLDLEFDTGALLVVLPETPADADPSATVADQPAGDVEAGKGDDPATAPGPSEPGLPPTPLP